MDPPAEPPARASWRKRWCKYAFYVFVWIVTYTQCGNVLFDWALSKVSVYGDKVRDRVGLVLLDLISDIASLSSLTVAILTCAMFGDLVSGLIRDFVDVLH